MTTGRSSPTRRPPLVITASLQLYRVLLVLHPRAFRREYGASILQVFAQECRDAKRAAGVAGVLCLWPRALGDLLAGAAAEHFARLVAWWKGSASMGIYRQSASEIFAAFVAYVIAGIGFQKMSEDVVKSSLPASHPLLTISYDTVAVGAVLALLAVLVGGVPITLAALRDTLRRRRVGILMLFAVPPVSLAVLAGYALLLVRKSPGHALVWTLIGFFIVAAVVSTAAVLGAVGRSDVDARLYRFARIPGAVAALAMLGTLVASAAWSVVLWQNAPGIFFGNDGILATSTVASTIAHTGVMLAAAIIAIRATLRGLSKRDTGLVA
jgi:hypothetical protein